MIMSPASRKAGDDGLRPVCNLLPIAYSHRFTTIIPTSINPPTNMLHARTHPIHRPHIYRWNNRFRRSSIRYQSASARSNMLRLMDAPPYDCKCSRTDGIRGAGHGRNANGRPAIVRHTSRQPACTPAGKPDFHSTTFIPSPLLAVLR